MMQHVQDFIRGTSSTDEVEPDSILDQVTQLRVGRNTVATARVDQIDRILDGVEIPVQTDRA